MGNMQSEIRQRYFGIGIALGAAIGTGLGIALGNLALSIGPGIAFGVALGLILGNKHAKAAEQSARKVVCPSPASAGSWCAPSATVSSSTYALDVGSIRPVPGSAGSTG